VGQKANHDRKPLSQWERGWDEGEMIEVPNIGGIPYIPPSPGFATFSRWERGNMARITEVNAFPTHNPEGTK